MASRADISLWSILKQCIGKELSKITMPVAFNEPLSLIQRFSEFMEYAMLIETASRCDDPLERMEYVVAFVISAVSGNWGRIGKPFNPLLGETFELNRPDLGFRYIGEQVSHHPPITAYNAEGTYYTFSGSLQPKLKFWGKTVEITPKGLATLTLHRYRETYTWQNVACIVHNVMVGNLWVEQSGQMEICCNKSNISATIHFKPVAWFGKDAHRVEAFIFNGKVKKRTIFGSWILGVFSCSPEAYETYMHDSFHKSQFNEKQDTDDTNMKVMTYNFEISGQKTLWLANPRLPHADSYYNFSTFSMGLNELLPGMKETLPPTDTRLRPDIRFMEDGQLDQSSVEKVRIEDKQRYMRDERKKKNEEWQPLWFSLQKNVTSAKDDWVCNNNYWKRDWSNCENIF